MTKLPTGIRRATPRYSRQFLERFELQQRMDEEEAIRNHVKLLGTLERERARERSEEEVDRYLSDLKRLAGLEE